MGVTVSEMTIDTAMDMRSTARMVRREYLVAAQKIGVEQLLGKPIETFLPLYHSLQRRKNSQIGSQPLYFRVISLFRVDIRAGCRCVETPVGIRDWIG